MSTPGGFKSSRTDWFLNSANVEHVWEKPELQQKENSTSTNCEATTEIRCWTWISAKSSESCKRQNRQINNKSRETFVNNRVTIVDQTLLHSEGIHLHHPAQEQSLPIPMQNSIMLSGLSNEQERFCKFPFVDFILQRFCSNPEKIGTDSCLPFQGFRKSSL